MSCVVTIESHSRRRTFWASLSPHQALSYHRHSFPDFHSISVPFSPLNPHFCPDFESEKLSGRVLIDVFGQKSVPCLLDVVHKPRCTAPELRDKRRFQVIQIHSSDDWQWYCPIVRKFQKKEQIRHRWCHCVLTCRFCQTVSIFPQRPYVNFRGQEAPGGFPVVSTSRVVLPSKIDRLSAAPSVSACH
jgi:hypothetical protein